MREKLEPRKKRKLNEVEISMSRAIEEEKSNMNPYRSILPHHSSPKNSRNIRNTRRQELDRIEEGKHIEEDPNLR